MLRLLDYRCWFLLVQKNLWKQQQQSHFHFLGRHKKGQIHHYNGIVSFNCFNNNDVTSFSTTTTTKRMNGSAAAEIVVTSNEESKQQQQQLRNNHQQQDDSYCNSYYTPIVIVGGGPSGLFMSLLLSQYNIPNILLEAQSIETRYQHPQAHFLNTRTMEIMKHSIISNNYNNNNNSNNNNNNNSDNELSSSSLSSSTLYERIRLAMPPVYQWEKFRFAYSMQDTNPLAEIIHPVNRPIQMNTDTNGILVERNNNNNNNSDSFRHHHNNNDTTPSAKNGGDRDLSPCTVGHLAQHTFCKILLEATIQQHQYLKEQFNSTQQKIHSGIFYSSMVTNVQYDTKNHLYNVHTEDGKIYKTPLIVAADGANSHIRQKYCHINFLGQENIQHLVNIHVQLTPEQASEIHSNHQNNNNNNNHAMLYSIFNETIIAMVVCHSIGEYIIQIPYFPPYQTMEDDFGLHKLPNILQAIFGKLTKPIDCNKQIKSCKSWIMNSMIAERYYIAKNNNSGIVLVGDAAHVFPPAGGFGMNTGIQDVHNLAWKIASWYYNNNNNNSTKNIGDLSSINVSDDEQAIIKQRMTDDTPSSTSTQISLQSMLESYQAERRPIAQANAALSVRNYNRLLDVTKAIYLNNQHPELLQRILHISSLPLPAKQVIFRSLLQTALFPLRYLQQHQQENESRLPLAPVHPGKIYATHIRNNIQKVLKSGAGLPLLFPKYEIGFTYDNANMRKKEQQSNDTWADPPVLSVNSLVPHVEVEVVEGLEYYPFLKYLKEDGSNQISNYISTRDLAAQMTSYDENDTSLKPSFSLLVVCRSDIKNKNNEQVESICQDLSNKLGLPVKIAQLIGSKDTIPNLLLNHQRLYIRELNRKRQPFSLFDDSPLPGESYYILIRPDGHISAIDSDLRNILNVSR